MDSQSKAIILRNNPESFWNEKLEVLKTKSCQARTIAELTTRHEDIQNWKKCTATSRKEI